MTQLVVVVSEMGMNGGWKIGLPTREYLVKVPNRNSDSFEQARRKGISLYAIEFKINESRVAVRGVF